MIKRVVLGFLCVASALLSGAVVKAAFTELSTAERRADTALAFALVFGLIAVRAFLEMVE